MALETAWNVHCPHPTPPEQTMYFALDEDRGPKVLLCPACWDELRALFAVQGALTQLPKG